MRLNFGEQTMRSIRVYLIAVMLVAFVMSTTASPVRIRVTDPAGAEGVARALVIVQALNGKGEVLRTLSDSNGSIPSMDLSAGVYRVIATYPYGYWFTQVREFVVSDAVVDIELHMEGAVVEAVQVPEVQIKVSVVDQMGKPAPDALVLGRDPAAKFNHWAKADEHGQAMVTIGVNGADVVAIYKGQVVSKRVDIPFQDAECSDRDCMTRVIEKLKNVPQSLTLQLQ